MARIKWYCSLCEKTYSFKSLAAAAKHWAGFHYGNAIKFKQQRDESKV